MFRAIALGRAAPLNHLARDNIRVDDGYSGRSAKASATVAFTAANTAGYTWYTLLPYLQLPEF